MYHGQHCTVPPSSAQQESQACKSLWHSKGGQSDCRNDDPKTDSGNDRNKLLGETVNFPPVGISKAKQKPICQGRVDTMLPVPNQMLFYFKWVRSLPGMGPSDASLFNKANYYQSEAWSNFSQFANLGDFSEVPLSSRKRPGCSW